MNSLLLNCLKVLPLQFIRDEKMLPIWPSTHFFDGGLWYCLQPPVNPRVGVLRTIDQKYYMYYLVTV